MGFLSELIELPLEQTAQFRYTVIGDKYLYLAGHIGIKSVDNQCIVFTVGKTLLSIVGEGLYIKHLSSNDAVIGGEIRSASLIK